MNRVKQRAGSSLPNNTSPLRLRHCYDGFARGDQGTQAVCGNEFGYKVSAWSNEYLL